MTGIDQTQNFYCIIKDQSCFYENLYSKFNGEEVSNWHKKDRINNWDHFLLRNAIWLSQYF